MRVRTRHVLVELPSPVSADAHDNAPTLRPPTGGWRTRATPPRSAIVRRFRRELLGIDDDARVVMSGHQAAWWHPGILAKWFAMEALAQTHEHAAWVVVDQDDNEPVRVPYPRAGVARGVWTMGDAVDGVATGARPAVASVSPPPTDAVTEDVARGLTTIARAMTNARGAASLADQVRLATLEVLTPLSLRPVRTFHATAMARTTLFSQFIDAMRRDAARCVALYNRAVARTPHAGVRPLLVNADATRVELPLWAMKAGSARRPVFAHELATLEVSALAPRALAMTALLRLGGCDVFIHGLGGGAYDVITDAWLREWLPLATPELAAVTPAPTGVVSATRFVAMATPTPIASPAALARATWSVHHARHTPAMLELPDMDARKRALVAKIASLPRRSAERTAAYRELHALLDDARAHGQRALGTWSDRASAAAASRALAAIVYDRTWAFPLHDAASLLALREQVRAGLAGE